MDEYGSTAGAGPSQPQKRRRTHKQRFSRSRTGCLTCRGRRIRCDETHPTCERCVELELSCVWPPNSSSAKPSRQTTPNPLSQGTPYDPPGSAAYVDNVQGPSTSSWADQGVTALTSLYDFTNTDLSVPWDVNLGDMLTGTVNGNGNGNGNGAAIEPYYGTPAGQAAGIGLGWTPSDVLQNGVYVQSTPVSTSTSSFEPLGPIPETSIVLNSSADQLPWRNTSNNIPTFPSYYPYPFPISISIPSTINDPIEHIFPSADSKMIFQHVRSKTSTTITALTSQSQTSTQNPFMDMALRTIMIDPTSHAQTAFRHATLSLGAAHVCHQYAKASPVQAQKMRVRTVKSNRKAMGFLGIGTRQAEQTDLVLATCLTLAVRNTLCADPAWMENMTFAMRHISRRGGPTALLSESIQGCDRRFILEQLAVVDIFSTFTTGDEPCLLGESATWWTESGPSSGAYERYLGISREMTEMVAQYRIIHSRMTRLKEKGGPADAMAKAASEGTMEAAKALLDKLNKWDLNRSTVTQIKRIQNGDTAYRYTIEISLQTEILHTQTSDSRVQTPVRSILELCSQMSQEPINLLWPLLTAGAYCIGEENRGWVRQLIDVFRPFYCQDLEVAEMILMEQWTRIDCGAGFTTWSELMKDMGKTVCLK